MGKADLIKDIIEYHRRVSRVLRDYDTDIWMSLSLTLPQLKSLFFISNQGVTNYKKLAEKLNVTQSNLTGIIDRLIDQGMVKRGENPKDRRELLLQATEKGESLVAELRGRRSSYLSQSLDDLQLEKLTCISRGLEILAQATEEHARLALAGNNPPAA